MDISVLAHDVTTSLVPLLPYLLKAGEKAAEETGKKLAGAAWEEVKKLWLKLSPKIEARPAALDAAHEVAATPDDADAKAALRLQLKKLFSEDENLAKDVNDWLESARVANVNVSSSGARSVAIGGDVQKSTVITGNRNSLEG